jgi:hypothetical protein
MPITLSDDLFDRLMDFMDRTHRATCDPKFVGATIKLGEKVFADARHELHGATYKTVMHEQTQSGDPLRFPPHGVPPQYAHPMNLRSLISEDAVRALPVSQEIEHGPSQSRTAEFASAAEEDYVMRQAGFLVHHHYATVGFRDRRSDGRRFRPTDNTEDMYGPQEPYNIESQTDHNTMDRLTMKKL